MDRVEMPIEIIEQGESVVLEHPIFLSGILGIEGQKILTWEVSATSPLEASGIEITGNGEKIAEKIVLVTAIWFIVVTIVTDDIWLIGVVVMVMAANYYADDGFVDGYKKSIIMESFFYVFICLIIYSFLIYNILFIWTS